MRFLFKACGWVLSEDPGKDVGFQQSFSALGVRFDLEQVHLGILRTGNTDKRKSELRALVTKHLTENSLTPESRACREHAVKVDVC